MNRSLPLGVLLLLCGCSTPDPDAAAQQLTPSPAVATSDSAPAASAVESQPVAAPATPSNQNGDPSMQATNPGAGATLRPSFETCIAQSGGVTPAMQDCIAVEAEYQEGRLASVYARLLASLPPSDRQALENEQSAWLREKDAACTWDTDEEGQGQRLEANECGLQMTATRAQALEMRLQSP